jgi:hypothetical protein
MVALLATGGGVNRLHLWFSVPRGGREVPHKSILWELPGAKHQAVEVLGDRALVVAPPSPFGPDPGRYAFLAGRGPADLDAPAPLPAWVSDSLVDAPRPRPLLAYRPLSSLAKSLPLSRRHLDRRDVLAAIPDPCALAASWGVRFAYQRVNARGWRPCFAAFREDRSPSAMMSAVTGCYWEPWMDRTPCSLFDLAAALGVYPSWQEAVDQLGHLYGVQARHAG